MDNLISIVIPVHNQPKYTFECLTSIRENTENYEIIIVDNGSRPPITKSKRVENVRVSRNEKNLGFPMAVNQGIEKAWGEFIVVLNNDVIVTPRWAEYLMYHMTVNKFDIVGPCTNSISGPQQKYVKVYDGKEELYERSKVFHSDNAGMFVKFHRIVGFCMMFRKSLVDEIGMFDEAFSPGNYEDDDFCFRAIDAGYKTGIAKDVFVHHFGCITHKALGLDYNKLLEKNQKMLFKKWPEEERERLIKKLKEM